ncbi:carotenoid oxygenase family protein [Mycolicibacterium novocastrense]|nr:carotenoid oxygenase family protein [Mycolicibacterium novocastrense]
MTTAQAAESQNPYLEGFLAPVSTEVTATDLPVTGRIPEHLDGRYLRNGPNPVAEVDPATYHWFTGDAMVHGVALRDGRPAGIAIAGSAHPRCAPPWASPFRPGLTRAPGLSRAVPTPTC